MINIFIVLLMIFMHIVDDYYLQGWLASAKQKKWWEENAPDKLYENDYAWALLMHAFSWSFMIMLPIAFVKGFNIGVLYLIVFMFNWSIMKEQPVFECLNCAYEDDRRANGKS